MGGIAPLEQVNVDLTDAAGAGLAHWPRIGFEISYSRCLRHDRFLLQRFWKKATLYSIHWIDQVVHTPENNLNVSHIKAIDLRRNTQTCCNVFAYFQKHNSLYGAACVIIIGTKGQTGGTDAGVKEK